MRESYGSSLRRCLGQAVDVVALNPGKTRYLRVQDKLFHFYHSVAKFSVCCFVDTCTSPKVRLAGSDRACSIAWRTMAFADPMNWTAIVVR
jgi:hypothetical protein